MLQEHVPGRLLGVDPNTVVSDDRAAIIIIIIIN